MKLYETRLRLQEEALQSRINDLAENTVIDGSDLIL
jgi:hypothetical protein